MLSWYQSCEWFLFPWMLLLLLRSILALIFKSRQCFLHCIFDLATPIIHFANHRFFMQPEHGLEGFLTSDHVHPPAMVVDAKDPQVFVENLDFLY